MLVSGTNDKWALLLATVMGAGCSAEAGPADLEEDVIAQLDSATVQRHVAALSHDSLEGRGTGTRGEAMAVAYIAEQMRSYGLRPAGDDGTFVQEVPLIASTPAPEGPLVVRSEDGRTLSLAFGDEYIASTDLTSGRVTTTSDLIFAGYGIHAPMYEWDDFGETDVSGKVLVLFVNDPITTPEEPGLFQADTLTYFGRWTYKQEEARRRGATGVILIHTLETAGYPFSVLGNTALGQQMQLPAKTGGLELKAWITRPAAERLAEFAGSSLDGWFREANTRGFRATPLGMQAHIDMAYRVERRSGMNVVGKIPGSGAPETAVAYLAHHDHLGIGLPDATGDSLYNGAVDNATGVGMLLGIAEAFASAARPPARSLLFITTTAEEEGLLGSEYYAANPSIPMAATVGVINLDSGNVFGPTEDAVGIGAERSTLLEVLRRAAEAEGMSVSPDPNPGQGSFFRSDQLSFARAGVPGIFLKSGARALEGGKDAIAARSSEYNLMHYHQPSDEFDPTWPMSGLLQQMRIAIRIGYAISYDGFEPEWNEGEAFGRTETVDGRQ